MLTSGDSILCNIRVVIVAVAISNVATRGIFEADAQKQLRWSSRVMSSARFVFRASSTAAATTTSEAAKNI
jgi:hypothetical protein